MSGENGTPVLDFVGVGFGPSNLALAIAVHEHNADPSVGRRMNAEFVEVKPEFGWHTGMLLPGTTMQISFLKDLVTQRNPQSEFTFLNYLTERGRLTEFINYKTFFPTRLEFHDYLAWSASKVDATVRYGSRVSGVREVDGVFEVEVTGRHAGRLRARNVVVAGGLQPQLPPGITASPRLIHNHCLLHDLEHVPSRTHDRYIGSGRDRARPKWPPICTTSHRPWKCTACSPSTGTARPTTARSRTGSSTRMRSTTSSPPTPASAAS